MKIDLHYSDCMTVLPKLIGVADLVLTDPPYRLTSGGKPAADTPHKVMRGGWMKDYNNNGRPVDCDIEFSDWVPDVAAAMKENADFYAMVNSKNMLPLLQAMTQAKIGLHTILAWDKRTATANRWYMQNIEFVAYGWRGRARSINDCTSKQLIHCPQIDESDHATEKPVALMEHYIRNSTEPGATVLDPFMGSGTTGVACVRSGRNFIGIEKNLEHYKTAQRRIHAALEQYGGKNVWLC